MIIDKETRDVNDEMTVENNIMLYKARVTDTSELMD